MNNPISLADENGKFVGVVIAWGVGIGALEAGIEYLDQVSGGNIFDFSSYDFSRKIDGTKIIGAFGKGFCIGSFGVLGAGAAASASAAGATKLVQGAWTYGGNIAGGVLGGMTDRTITGDEPVDGDEMVKDGVLAGVGTWVSGKTSLYLMGKKNDQ